MLDSLPVNRSAIALAKGDITDLDIEAFVYYAQPNLELGSGFGTAIAVRGGPTVPEELKKLGPLQTTEATVTSAGNLKAKHIVHAVGPRFQEPDLENKLRLTVENCLRLAESKGIREIAFPPMGAGFYGVPLALCAQVMLAAISDYLAAHTGIERVVISLLDNREFKPFQDKLAAMSRTYKEAS